MMTTLYRASITGNIIPIDVCKYNDKCLWVGDGTRDDRMVRFTKNHGFFETLEEASMWSAYKLAKEIESREKDLAKLKVKYERLSGYNDMVN